jgi:hypothetical protein
MSDRLEIKVVDVQQMLREGKTRNQIGEHYGLNKTATGKLFAHPELKGRRTHKDHGFTVISSEGVETLVGGTVQVAEEEVLVDATNSDIMGRLANSEEELSEESAEDTHQFEN